MQQKLIIILLYSVICLLSSVLGPLHLSRILYKSALFMQNKPNFRKSQMNVNSLLTKDYENKSNWTLGENKPNQTQFHLLPKGAEQKSDAERMKYPVYGDCNS